jgi:hypothetical protein
MDCKTFSQRPQLLEPPLCPPPTKERAENEKEATSITPAASSSFSSAETASG